MQRIDFGAGAVDKKADITIAIGATGSGKSTRCKLGIQSRGIERLIVWDWMREYTRIPEAKTLADLYSHIKTAPRFAVRFCPSYDTATRLKQFDAFCSIAMSVGDLALLAEELSKVVRANGSGEGWERVCTEGRHRALSVYGTSQRPALIDKTSLSQATQLYCGNLELPADFKVMSSILGVPDAELQALGPWDYIERHRETKALYRGNLANGLPGVANAQQKTVVKELKSEKKAPAQSRKKPQIAAIPQSGRNRKAA